MRKIFLKLAFSLAVLLGSLSTTQAGWFVGVGFGGPYYPYYRPYPYYPYYPYYRPYPYYPYYAPPVVGAPPRAVYPPSAYPPPSGNTLPAPQPSSATLKSPVPAPSTPPNLMNDPTLTPDNTPLSVRLTEPPVLTASSPNDLNQYLQRLSDSNIQVRSETAMTLGRSKSLQAVAPLERLLANDQSPAVREAAARALGLIGSQDSLKALQTAAQGDDDSEVRHSARFAAESIRGK